ncbi:glycoprotein-N-acetylgalactosamine 3-beta-galactosyltransferase 1-like [Clytia hemisphaerica]|uniref:Glycoprotein-N-acetylgalactosamine 3-beta-galactosyltransferase 1 n=1 Tax=Clytia hemisphaerica TaxID=252671 RepID=A0A7M5V8J9_9CNID|eukprot:TCONS_00002137-protein
MVGASFRREFHMAFLLGLSFGFFIAVIFRELQSSFSETKDLVNKGPPSGRAMEEDYAMLLSEEYEGKHLPPPSKPQPVDKPIIFNDLDSIHHKGGDRVAKLLSKKVRILCWIMTQPKTLKTKAQAVKNTWGKRCNTLLFMSSKGDKDFPVVGLNVPEGRKNLWLKTRAAWKYIYEHHFYDADWFLKADDDSFVVLENLRYFLSKHNSSQTHYFGRHFRPFGGYNSGGAGYVFSKATLIVFNQVLRDPSVCKLKAGAEDAEVGVCLRMMGVVPGDTRDEFGRESFHPFAPDYHLVPNGIPTTNWLHKYNKHPVKSGPGCCSDHSIAFHYIPPNRMYVMEYFIYHLRPFGVHHVHN